MAGASNWTADVFVDAGETAKKRGIVATDGEIAEIATYLLYHGWVVTDDAETAERRYAVTRHGLEESQRKLPAEPKPHHMASDDR
jgi:hypothetical protein